MAIGFLGEMACTLRLVAEDKGVVEVVGFDSRRNFGGRDGECKAIDPLVAAYKLRLVGVYTLRLVGAEVVEAGFRRDFEEAVKEIYCLAA